MPPNQERARRRCVVGNLELEEQEGTVGNFLAAELGSTRNDKEIEWNTLPPLEPMTSPVWRACRGNRRGLQRKLDRRLGEDARSSHQQCLPGAELVAEYHPE